MTNSNLIEALQKYLGLPAHEVFKNQKPDKEIRVKDLNHIVDILVNFTDWLDKNYGDTIV